MSQQEQASRIAALLYTDMVDSVALERRLGTEAYSRLLKLHHQLFRFALATVGGGKIHFDSGDGFLSEFATAAGAVNTALLFQMFIRRMEWESEAPRVRIGLHQGQLAEIRLDPESPGKIVGLPVSIAARVMGIAQPGQILMTRAVYDDARQFVRTHPVVGREKRGEGREKREENRGERESPLPSAFFSLLSGPSPPLKWESHGPYLFKGTDGPLELFEVGASGLAPLTAPPNSEKGRRMEPAGKPRPRWTLPRPRVAAALTALCGLMLLTNLGDAWTNASYDYIFRFSARSPANNLVLIQMDNEAFNVLKQSRGSWDRALHAALLNKLTEAGASLVVFDILFREPRDKDTDAALAAAIRRHGRVVLQSMLADPSHPDLQIAEVVLPDGLFLQAAAAQGIGQAEVPVARRHWPFPAPAEERYQSLPWTAARLAGAELSEQPHEQWLRYYGENGPWQSLSYHFALSNAPAYFRGKIVFIGNKPESSDASLPEKDKFRTPYTRWSGQAVGGVEILATTFLNLMNRDWLRRLPWTLEALLLVLSGGILGAGLCRFNRLPALGLATGLAVLVFLAGVSLSYFSNFWFPWLIVVGGQIPCALAVALARAKVAASQPATSFATTAPLSTVVVRPASGLPETPDYELFDPPFGEGGFGRVWLARNAIGQWQALKAVYQAKFGSDPGPYEAEFKGIKRFKPVSEKHPGLLRVDFVSRMKPEGYFYYVMELGDAQAPGWQENPSVYKPRDLAYVRGRAEGGRLPVPFCVRVGLVLAEGLDFLHQQGLTHRDIKPSNVIFVNDRPKLADVGLVTEIRTSGQASAFAGTAGYMPPTPEPPGTVEADIYALGMVLYVISTGRAPAFFPELATALMEESGRADFLRLNAIILKACQPDRTARYKSAAELADALRQVQQAP